LDDLLRRRDIDAVFVGTTNDLHSSQTLAALEAGKHVLCEKPLALTLADARAMVTTAERNGVVLGTNHHLRHSGAHRAMRSAIKDGRIGQPLAAKLVHAAYLPKHLHGWRLRDRTAGGVILDFAAHDADTLRFILGEDPLEVSALAQSLGMTSADLEDGAVTISRFSSQLVAVTHDAFTTGFAEGGVDVDGTEGTLIARDTMTQRPLGTLVLRNAKGERSIEFDREGLYIRGVREFQNLVRGHGSSAATGVDGLKSLAFALAARKAVSEQRVCRIDYG
jgi:1,5-anhydro-D-fructose reductase (1,5-anhydro-D-mannitol-forming)